MKNITIKLDDDTAHWSKVWAAEHNTSVSQILGNLLRKMKKEKSGYTLAMNQFMSVKPQKLRDTGLLPSREELHER